MIPFRSVVSVKAAAAVAAGLLAAGLAGSTAAAASTPSPSPSPKAKVAAPKHRGDARQDHRQIAAAVFEAEADVLGMKPEELREAIRSGKTVEQLARDRKGMNKDQFADALEKNLKPRLDKLVDSKAITRAQADRVLDGIAKGHIPHWDRPHHHTKG